MKGDHIRMKLSMWTLCDYLIKNGFNVESYISEGLPCISLIQQSNERSYSAGYAEVFKSGADVYVANEMDRLTVKDAQIPEVLNCLGEALDSYNQWEHELIECILRKGSLQDMLEIAKRVFDRPMFIKDDATRTLAITHGYSSDVHPFWGAIEGSDPLARDPKIVSAVSSDPEYKLAFTDKYPSIRSSPAYGAMVLHANIFVNNVRAAEVVTLENGKPFNKGDMHLMNVFTELLGKYVDMDPHVFQTASDAMVTFKNLIETGTAEKEQFDIIRQYMGIDSVSNLCVAVISGDDRLDSPILSALREKLESQMKDAAVTQTGSLIAVLKVIRKQSYHEIIDDLKRRIPKEGFCWSLSYEFGRVEDIGLFFKQSCEMLEKAVFGTNHYVTAYEMAPRMIESLCEKNPVSRTYVHPDLLRLENLDIRDNAEYCETLFYYLLCGGNYTDAAKIMNLHRNTLIYRINKIREIVRINIDDIRSRESLIYSYLLLNKDY